MIAEILYDQLGSTLVWLQQQQPNTVQHQHLGPVDPMSQYSQDTWVNWPDVNQRSSNELPWFNIDEQ